APGIITVGEIVARCGYQPNVAPGQQRNSKLSDHKLARKARGVLDNNGVHAVALDAIKQRGDPATPLDRIGTADGGIVVLRDDLVPSPLRKALYGRALTLI